MDINTLKEYVRLNSRCLSPTADDCSNSALYKEFADTVLEIKERHNRIKKFYYNIVNSDKEEVRFNDITITSFLLMCVPLLLSYIIGEHVFGNQAGAAFGYIITLVILMVRIYLQGFASHFRVSTIGHTVRIILLILCGYFHVFKQATFFGTTGMWVFAYVVIGTAVTVLIRFLDKSRIEKQQQEYIETQEDIKAISTLSDRCEQLYVKLSDKATTKMQTFLKDKSIKFVPTKRNVWFRFDRTFDKHGVFIVPTGHAAAVNFKEPFNASTETSEKNQSFLVNSSKMLSSDKVMRGDYLTTEKKTFTHWINKDPCDEDFLRNFISEKDMNIESKDSKITVETIINSQEFGWQDISASYVESLVSSGKIYPYFGMGIPEFSTELQYRVFRHQFDVTVNTTYNNFYVFQQRYDSKDQIKFDADVAFTEVLHNYGKIRTANNPFWLEEKISQYEEMKEAAREDVGSVYVPVCKAHEYTVTEKKQGDEIGAVFVFTPDGTLVGVYAGDSKQALDFVDKELSKYSDFKPTIYSQPFGYSQIQEMRRKYFC